MRVGLRNRHVERRWPAAIPLAATLFATSLVIGAVLIVPRLPGRPANPDVRPGQFYQSLTTSSPTQRN
jgi:hypothetical protein